MAGIQDFVEFCDDFLGTVATLPASADPATPWLIDDTSSSGTPTYTTGTSAATLTLASTNEIENVCLHFNDSLDFDIDDLIHAEFRVKTVASLNATTSIAFGMATARNDAIDSIASHASFRLIGSNAVVVETDDAVIDNDDVSTGKTLVATYKRFVIDFQNKSDIKFYIDGERVAGSTTFSMANFTTGLQPYVQIQKTADTNVNSVTVDYVRIVSKRS